MLRLTLFTVLSYAAAFGQALEGLDPVLLIEGKEVAGKQSLKVDHGRFTYVFAEEATRNKFRSDPERYSIQLGGACARMGAPVGGSPDAYYVYEGRIYIFGSQECYRRFTAEPRKYLAAAQPAPDWAPTPASTEEGGRMLARLLDAHGGKERIARLTSSVENRGSETRVLQPPQKFRSERTFAMGSAASMVDGEQGWQEYQGESHPVPADFARAIADSGGRDVVRILWAAAQGKLQAYAGSPVRLVVREGRLVTTLTVSADSGRIEALEYWGRGPDGAFGAIRIAFGDYRDTGGIWLPFRGEAAINSKPEPTLAWTTARFELK